MRKRFAIVSTVVLVVTLGSVPVIGQVSSYLTQKLMLENDLRERIDDALSKIIDPSRYVVDVSVELELTDAVEEQVTFGGDQAPAAEPTRIERKPSDQARELESAREDSRRKSTGQTSGGLPIPGFEFEMEGGTQEEPTVEEPVTPEPEPEITTPKETAEPKDNIVSRTSSTRRPSRAQVIRQDISIILQEGAAPELIENIRQVVMVASRFNRSRGDKLSIMTASFKERRDEKTAEQILLKTIAQKIETMQEAQEAEDAQRDEDWRTKLKQYQEEEAQRRKEDRQYFNQELSKLEAEARQRAFEQEKREILQRDSLRLQALNQEIEELKQQLTTAAISDTQAVATQTAVQQKQQERDELDRRIEEKIAQLNTVQTDLDRLQDDMDGTPTMTTVLLSLLGGVVLILLIALIWVLMNRNRQQRYSPPPPWMYPPRRPPKKKKKKPVAKPEPEEEPAPAPKPAQKQPSEASPQQPPVDEDPGVLQSEISDMKQAVVSMSVGQPNTATRIVKEWMQEEAPPPPEPEETPETAEEPEEEETSGKKKKKKKA